MSDDDILALVRDAFDGQRVASCSRRPFEYATSSAIDELEVAFDDGTRVTVLLKDLARERLIGDARWSKPEFLHEPRREIETHLRLLGPAGLGPRCYGAVDDAPSSRHWLILEKVAGVELWQVGDVEVWARVARWLAGFHARFADRVPEVRAANPHLLELDANWFRSWNERARATLQSIEDDRAATLHAGLAGYEGVVERLAALPVTFVHGELYPSNVIVGSETDGRVCPIDWEMAATGPGLVDLAALVGGWDPQVRDRLTAAYGSVSPGDLDRCRLHLALQWIGWSPGWQAPPEHAHDWIGEALGLVERLGL